jgi:repressor LexA
VARNGDIVVALVRQHEATLKRMERRGERVRLLPANPAYPVQEYPAAEVEIQGVLVGLLRWY